MPFPFIGFVWPSFRRSLILQMKFWTMFCTSNLYLVGFCQPIHLYTIVRYLAALITLKDVGSMSRRPIRIWTQRFLCLTSECCEMTPISSILACPRLLIPSCIQTATIYKGHCEYFVPQHKLSEAIPGPDLACTDTVMEKQASSVAEAITYSNHVAPPDPVSVSGRGGRALSEGIAEPVPSAARNLSFCDVRPLYFSVVKERPRVCFGFASQPLGSSQ